ncbi:MFS transporter [Halobaculum sp. MBLA0147]|uniref:MFS transporter n=1 Tax=Halobaculum sp. MBLA0147 TaxID=3079934 RepID=UPI0035245348
MGWLGLAERYYVYRALVPEGFVYPVVNLYLQARGLGLRGLGLANAAFFLGIVLGEVPTGYLGDRLGRRNSLIVSAALVSTTMVLFTVASSLPAFVAVFWLWGVAVTFRSGSGGAWLYDALAERDAADAFTRVQSRSGTAFFASSAAMALPGGVLYDANREWPFLAAAVTTGLGAVWLVGLPSVDAAGDDEFAFADAWAVARERFPTHPLGTGLVVTTLLLSFREVATVFLQPLARDAGVSTELFGPLYAGLMLWGAAVSYVVDDLRQWLGTSGGILVAAGCFSLPMATAVVVPALVLPAYVAIRAGNRIVYPLRSQFLNDRLPSDGRATVLSVASLGSGLVYAGARAVGGVAAEWVGPVATLAGLGSLALLVTVGVRLVADPFATDPDAYGADGAADAGAVDGAESDDSTGEERSGEN